ncbi:LysR family transcriptional regulator [Rhizobium sp. G187]|uniref:LysR family transcriptional regulator n=1 Tax=Rhizobium sp. G187 TaxID=3451352 RepID=UPI003EE5776C
MEFRHNLRALHTFETVSRHLSVSAAAAELGVTQSAVSHQLRLLAEIVGERLFQKSGRGIALTDAGRDLAQRLQPAFAEIHRSLAETIGGSRNRLRLAVCSSFATAWLVPRIRSFYAAHPDIDLQIMMYAQDPELTDAMGDAFVTTLPRDPGYHAQLLWPELLVPVVSSALIDGKSEFNYITTELLPGRIGSDWHAYARHGGRADLVPADDRWLFASHYIVALDMVRLGLGAALLPDFLVAREIKSGSLRLLHDATLPTLEDYHLCIKESRRSEPALDALVQWFRQEVPKPNGAQRTGRLRLVQP